MIWLTVEFTGVDSRPARSRRPRVATKLNERRFAPGGGGYGAAGGNLCPANGSDVKLRGQGPRAEAGAARRLPACEARDAGGVTPRNCAERAGSAGGPEPGRASFYGELAAAVHLASDQLFKCNDAFLSAVYRCEEMPPSLDGGLCLARLGYRLTHKAC